LSVEIVAESSMQDVRPFLLGDWKVDPALDCISRGGVTEKIDPRNMEVLLALVERQGEVVSQRELEQAVWQDVVVANSSLYQSIAQLRKALGDDAKQSRYIQTIPRKGYRLVASVGVGETTADFAQDDREQHLDRIALQQAPPSRALQFSSTDIPTIVKTSLLATPIGESNLELLSQNLASAAPPGKDARKSGLAAVLSIVGAAIVVTAAGAWLAQDEDRSPSRATAVAMPNPKASGGPDSTDPLATGKALAELGRLYRQKGNPRAQAVLEQALEIQRRTGAAEWSTVASILSDLAYVYAGTEKNEESKRVFNEARSLFRQHGSEHSLQYANLLSNLSILEEQGNNPKEARRLARAALELAQSLNLKGNARTELAEKQLRFAALAIWEDDYSNGEKAVRAAIDIYRDTVPELDPERLNADGLLGLLLRHQGRLEAAGLLMEREIHNRKASGSEASAVAESLYALSTVRFSQHRVAEAEQRVREAISLTPVNNSDQSNFEVGFLRTTLGIYLLSQDKFADAETQLRQSLELLVKAFPGGHVHIASAQHYLGEVLVALGKLPEAEKALTQAIDYCTKTNAPTWRSARSQSALGEVRHRQRRFAEAEQQLVDSYHELVKEESVDYATKNRARERVVRFFSERGQQHYLRAVLATAERK
jgi:DNA-binding winged helix-turn-helix (wHTH) protein